MKLKLDKDLNIDKAFNKELSLKNLTETLTWLMLVFDGLDVLDYQTVKLKVFDSIRLFLSNNNETSFINELQKEIITSANNEKTALEYYLLGLSEALNTVINKNNAVDAANNLLLYVYHETNSLDLTMSERLRQYQLLLTL